MNYDAVFYELAQEDELSVRRALALLDMLPRNAEVLPLNIKNRDKHFVGFVERSSSWALLTATGKPKKKFVKFLLNQMTETAPGIKTGSVCRENIFVSCPKF